MHTLILPPEAAETMAISAEAVADLDAAERSLAARRGPGAECDTPHAP